MFYVQKNKFAYADLFHIEESKQMRVPAGHDRGAIMVVCEANGQQVHVFDVVYYGGGAITNTLHWQDANLLSYQFDSSTNEIIVTCNTVYTYGFVIHI